MEQGDSGPATDPPAQPQSPASAGGGYREITLAAIIFGVVVGAIMNAAITYAGLKIGFTIVGSAIAAVLGFGVLRGILRKGTILETNIGQTVASAVNTPNSGVIFTVPVLMLLGYSLSFGEFNFWLITLACVAGAILGCAFIVPLRKQMLDIERLRFPSATAVGAILRSPGAGAMKSVVLVIGIVISALIAAPAQLPSIKFPAQLDQLDTLVEEGRISRADMLLTRQIQGWIEAESAPAELIEHGRLVAELMEAKEANTAQAKKDLSAEERSARAQRVLELEQRIAHAADLAKRTIAETEENLSDRQRLLDQGFPLKLAKLAHAASDPDDELDGAWDDLRDIKAGWAANPLFGYADYQVRMTREVDADAEQVDFAYNGLGNNDIVLTQRVDRDRDGQADLLITDDKIDVGRFLGLPPQIQLVFAIAPFALGAGYLTGRAGLFVLAGGILAYIVINPVLYQMGWLPATVKAEGAPGHVFSTINRPLGIGLLLGGAMMGILASMPAIKEAFKAIAATGGRGTKAGRDELGLRVLIVAVLAALVLLFAAADFTGARAINANDPITNEKIETEDYQTEYNGYVIAFASAESLAAFEDTSDERKQQEAEKLAAHKKGMLADLDPHLRAAIIAVVGALWIWFAGIIIAQCTGMTDWSPISGMALLTVVLVMLLGGPGGVVGAVLIGAALCVAITCAADMMADLKTGYLVGAVPRKQQMVELFATGIGPLITMAVILVIAEGNMAKFGVPLGPGTETTAPQAQALEAVITGVQGGDMPYTLYGFGAIVGAILGFGAFSGLGVLVGLSMYLPFFYIATYGVGCLINMGASKTVGKRFAEEWGVPLAAGFIVGDAILGLGVNAAVLIIG